MNKKSKQSVRPNLLNDYHLLSYDALDSTNEEAKRLAAGGAAHGAVIWAKRQTDGKGRMGRRWDSPEGNLFVSFLLAPGCDIATTAQLSFVTAVAVLETLRPIVPEMSDVTCKWPNDILLDGKKIGGVLLESFSAKDENGKTQQWVVAGIGINVDSSPAGTEFPATHLKMAGVEIISAKIVLSRLVYNFIRTYDAWAKKGFIPIRKAWMDAAYGIGKKIEVRLPEENFSGVFHSIDRQGHLVLKLKGNSQRVVNAGDVFFKEK